MKEFLIECWKCEVKAIQQEENRKQEQLEKEQLEAQKREEQEREQAIEKQLSDAQTSSSSTIQEQSLADKISSFIGLEQLQQWLYILTLYISP